MEKRYKYEYKYECIIMSEKISKERELVSEGDNCKR